MTARATVRDVLAGVSDSELLAAIRRGDVSLVAGAWRFVAGGSYWERDTAMRVEAIRRGIL